MYAVVESGGKQHKVTAGDEILLDRREGKPGDKVSLGKVIFLGLDERPVSDAKDLTKAKVTGTIVEQVKGEKLIVFKYKAKKNYRRTRGHRQLLTKIKVEEIEFGKKKATAPRKKAKVTKEKKEKVEEKRVAKEKSPRKEGRKGDKKEKRVRKDQKKEKGKKGKKTARPKASTKKGTGKKTSRKKK